MAEWELSKENIQPLRQGRKVSAILEPQDSKKIAEEQNAYELALRTYEGDDPLEPWFNYIIWVEQTFSKATKEGNLNSLLEKCIKEFKGQEKYDQDPRFFEVWMKYADLSTHALEIYSYMFSEEVCHKLAKFYIEWAWHLEQISNYKKAEQTFKTAYDHIQDTLELDLVKIKHKQFQARVMKKMLEKDPEDEIEEAEEQRSVLSSLKSHKGKVSSVRIGANKIADGPGVLKPAGQVASTSKNSAKFQIYQGGENSDPVNTKSNIFNKERNRENEQDPGKWNQNRMGKKSQAVPFDKITTKPNFEVHQDEGLETPSKPEFKNNFSKALTSHKVTKSEEDNVALALFEPPDPTKKPMYCKHLVYQGVTEFQFEELRAARYLQKEARDEVNRKKEEMDRMQNAILQERQMMLREQERLRKELEEFKRQKEDFERF